MKHLLRLLLAAALAATFASTASARIERVVEKQFTVSGSGTLRVETQGGGIRVSPGADAVVRVKVIEKIRASSEAEADELLQKLELTFEQEGSDVRAMAKYENRPLGFHFGSWPPVQVDFEVTVPASYATELKTSGGSIAVGDLLGRAHLRTSGGSIALGRMGAGVDARTSGGSITLGGAGGEVDLRTSGGSITAGPVQGRASLSTSGGGIKIDSVVGGMRAHTSGGSIRAAITGPLREDCELGTSGGSVRVAVDKAAAFQLDASTSGGGVDAGGLTITMEKGGHGRSRLAGAVNGGGPLLKLRTSGGGISIQAN